MKTGLPKHPRILAIAPSWRGFGYALVEGLHTLVDWGEKLVEGNKNARCLEKVQELVMHYQPDVIVLEDTKHKLSRRAPRIRSVTDAIIRLAQKGNVKVICFSREQVLNRFFPERKATKYDVARKVAESFPEELAFRLPKKRRPWESEASRMSIFEAVALASMVR